MSDERKQLTPTQQAILYKAEENPNWSNTEIADAVDCSDSHVSETLNRWSPEDMDNNGTVSIEKTRDNNSGSFWLWLLFAPLQLSFWLVDVSLKITFFTFDIFLKFSFWIVALPFKILDVIFGGSANK